MNCERCWTTMVQTERPTISFTVFGEPVAQGRPRFSTAGGFVRAVDPAKSRDFKHYIRLAAAQHSPERPLEGPLHLSVRVYRSTPKSFSKKRASEAEIGKIRPTQKPDGSNYLKLVEDALNGLIWRDDSQIVEAHVSKWYSSRPRIEIKIQELEVV